MSININLPECESRENRLGSITGYTGTLKDLTERGCSGCLKNRDRCLNTSGQCAHFDAIDQLSVIDDAVVIDHAPAGCSTGHIMWNSFYRKISPMVGRKPKNVIVISSNMNESDTVFGATEKLKETIRFAYKRHNPKVIFITGSCTSGIIAEDIPSVVDEMKEELNIPISYSSCEGIRSKMWSSGFDAAQHAVVKALVKPPKEKRNTVNFIVFWPTIEAFLVPTLDAIGLKPLFLSGFANVEDHAHASESVATVGQCGVLTSYYGGALQEMYGVPFLQEHFPYGVDGFESWYRDLAKLVGKEAEAEAFIEAERAKYLPKLNEIRAKLKGKKAMIALGPGMAFEVVKILRDLGMEVVHTVGFHYDPKYDNNDGKLSPIVTYARESEDLDVTIADSQQHEVYKLLKKYKPDALFSRAHGSNLWAAKLGVVSIEYAGATHSLYSYAGLVEIGLRIIDELENRNFVKLINKKFVSPFAKSFEESPTFAYFEEERR